ncbi:TniQ family protein [Azospirillum sp. sgz301742]
MLDEHAGLPVRVRPYPDESLPGLIVRMSEENAFVGPYRMLRICRILGTIGTAAARPSSIGPLAELFVLPRETVQRASFCRPDGAAALLGHEVPLDFVTSERVRVCPLCLADAPYHRAVWSLSLSTACPLHAVRLVERCPRCRVRLTWTRGGFETCRCGQDLRETQPEPVDPAVLGGLRAVHERLAAPPGEFRGLAGAGGLGGVLKLVHRLGGMALGFQRFVKPLALADHDADLAVRVVDAGWRACADWPASYIAFLETLRSGAADRDGRYGMSKAFGALPTWLAKEAGEPVVDMARERLLEYAAGIPGMATRVEAVHERRGSLPSTQRTLPVKAAAQLIGTSDWKLHAVVRRHGLIVSGGGGSGEPMLMSLASAEAIAEEIHGLANVGAARKVLGVQQKGFEQIVAAGLLPSPATGPAAEIAGKRVWRIAELEALIDGVAAVCRKDRSARSGLLSLAAASVSLGASAGIGLGALVRAILDGRLAVHPGDAERPGLGRFVVDQVDVAALGRAVLKVESTSISLEDAATELGVKRETAYRWARAGLLPASKETDRRGLNGLRISREKLAAFKAEYVTAAELRGQRGLGVSKKLALALIAKGAVPVSGPSVDGARQYLFRRADIDALLARN